MRLLDFFNSLYRLHRLRDRSPQTVRLYQCTLRAFSYWLKRSPQLADLNDDTLSAYLAARAQSVSPETCRKEYDQLTALWRYANRKQLMKTWPDLSPPRCPKHNPQALTLLQLRRLLICADEHSYEMGQLVRLAWQTGERKSALLALRGHDVRGIYVLFRAETRKGSGEDNVCQISEDLADSLAILCKGNRYLFTQRSTWHHHFNKVAAQAGIRGKRLGFHTLRRSAASHLAAAGGNACEFLGHAKEETTRRWYLDKTITQAGNAACDLLPSLASPDS